MRTGTINLKSRTTLIYSSLTNKRLRLLRFPSGTNKNQRFLKFPEEINKEQSLRFPSETNNPASRRASSQPVIKLLLILAIVFVFAIKPVSAAWANSSLDRCKNITITNVGSTTLTNFPAYINLTYDSDMQADFDDIRFYNASCSNDGTLMDYEIENYTSSSRAHIWTRIPSLPGAGTTIAVYYKNNTGITNGENASGVWDSNYKAVWHMTEVNVTDSTSNQNNGTEDAGVTLNATGRIGPSLEFDGSGMKVNISHDTSLNMPDYFMVEAWIKTNDNTRHMIISKIYYDYEAAVDDPDVKAWYGNSAGWQDLSWSGFTADGNWHHIAFWVNKSNGTGTTWLDGVSLGTDSDTISTGNSASVFFIGARGDGSNPMNGNLDEIRLSDVQRSADWINQSYQIVENQASFVSFGSEESGTDWANEDLDKCMNITINNSGSETLTNFPAYINLTYDSDMQADFTDIRFYSNACNNKGTELDYEIENYTASTRAHIWVRIPSLPGAGTTIAVYYKNNTGVSSGENPTGVWELSFKGVWHMTETNATDSTSYQNNGTEQGNIDFTANGRIAGANDFNGSGGNFINVPDAPEFDIEETITIEAWIYWRKELSNTGSYLLSRWLTGEQAYIFTVNEWNRTQAYIRNESVAYPEVDSQPRALESKNSWRHVVFTYNYSEGTGRIYIDGAENNSETITGKINTGTSNITLGDLYLSTKPYNGTLDEVRLSNTTRSADWINQSYQIVENQASFVSFGSEESRTEDTTTPVVNINTSLNNIVTTDTTPSVDFNFTDSESSTANCTLYFDDTAYNYTTGINNNSQTTLTVNTSLSDANYSVYINCTDNASDIGKSGVLNIEIDTTAPAITSVINWSIDSTSAKINWTTNEPANGSVSYGTTTALGDGIENHSDLVTTHNVSLSGLSANTLYYYNVTSCDSSDNCNTSGPYNFTTTEGSSCTPPSTGGGNWANSSFDRCMNITITNSGAETLTNFPAYINLTYDSDMLSDFTDIRFYNTSCNNGGTELDYEIENYTSSTRAHIWTRIPSLTSSGLTISVYYKNNTGVTSGENPSGVWSNNYSAVWHMSEVNITDSTGAGNNGTETGGVNQITGMIDGANDFNTTNYIDVPDYNIPNETGQRTVMGWVKLNDKFDNSTGRGIMRNMNFTGSDNDRGLAWVYRNDAFLTYVMNASGSRCTDTMLDNPADDTWYHITMVHDNTNLYYYINGNNTDTQLCEGSRKGWVFQFATYTSGSTNKFNGSLDEFRISNVTRSASWINMSYLIMANQSDYVSFGNEMEQPWANPYLDKCINITITNVGSTTLTNFPAYINLTYDSDMQADFDDIRFYNDACNNGGEELDYEIENYTSSSRAHIWTRIPSLTSSGKTISVYYKNNTGITNGENASGVWDSNFVMVQHMDDNNTTSVSDSTSYSNDGTKKGANEPNEVDGKIHKAQEFDSADDYVDTGSDDTIDNFFDGGGTISMWVRADTYGEGGYGTVFQKGNPAKITVFMDPAGIMWLWKTFSTTRGDWYWSFTNGTRRYLTIVYDCSSDTNSPTVYINGSSVTVSVDGSPSGTYISDAADYLTFGAEDTGGTYDFDGPMDEIRISNISRSADWINMSYQIVENQASFVSSDSEESKPAGSGTSDWTVNCSHNCYWTSNQIISGNLTFNDSGHVKLAANFTFNSTNQYITINSGCTFEIKSGGQIR